MIYFNQNQAINFRHEKVDKNSPLYNELWDGQPRRATVCELVETYSTDSKPTTRKVIASAVAFCHPNDNFNKEEGRKRSLLKMIDAARLDKKTKAMVCTAYWKRNAKKV